MKILEAMLEIEEDNRKVFIHKETKDTIKFENGCIVFCNGKGEYERISAISLDSEFEELLKPVTFYDALNARMNGKTIKCLFDSFENIYEYTEADYGCDVLIDSLDEPISIDEMKYGIWYIID